MKTQFLTLAMIAMLASACSGGQDSSSVPQGDLKKELNNEIRGYEFRRGVIVGADETPHWVQSAVSGYRETAEPPIAGKIELLPPKRECVFSAPKPDEFLAKVHVDGSDLETAVYAFSKSSINKLATEYIKEYRSSKGDAAPQVSRSTDALKRVDVIVTETSKPVYLVLAYSHPTIFNIQLASGASISRIALVGRSVSGLVKLDPQPPVEALAGADAALCGVSPVRKPADHWILVQRAKDGDELNKQAVKENMGYYSKYAKWFIKSFGQSSEPGSIGANEASHVLVGPLPQSLDARVPYTIPTGADVLLSYSDFAFSASEADYKAQKSQLIIDAAERAIGAKLETLVTQ